MPDFWTERRWQSLALWPLSLLYRALWALRALLYRWGVFRVHRLPVPVLVVGNVVAGGGGKTPTVMALVHYLRARGLRVGVVSRGYGRASPGTREVRPDSTAAQVGDEPLLIYKAFQASAGAESMQSAPVFVANQRADAARALLAAYPGTQCLVCDDGLQHLALARDLELLVFGDAGLGNGWLLPAGPLREPWPRQADLVLNTGMSTLPGYRAQRVLAPHVRRAYGAPLPLQALVGQPLAALAGIARPESFFTMLRAAGLTLTETIALPDHYAFDSFPASKYAGKQLICTEKDAVKLWPLVPDALAVPLVLTPEPAFFRALEALLVSRGITPNTPGKS